MAPRTSNVEIYNISKTPRQYMEFITFLADIGKTNFKWVINDLNSGHIKSPSFDIATFDRLTNAPLNVEAFHLELDKNGSRTYDLILVKDSEDNALVKISLEDYSTRLWQDQELILDHSRSHIYIQTDEKKQFLNMTLPAEVPNELTIVVNIFVCQLALYIS